MRRHTGQAICYTITHISDKASKIATPSPRSVILSTCSDTVEKVPINSMSAALRASISSSDGILRAAESSAKVGTSSTELEVSLKGQMESFTEMLRQVVTAGFGRKHLFHFSR
jgi:hypothetical protein